MEKVLRVFKFLKSGCLAPMLNQNVTTPKKQHLPTRVLLFE